MKVNELLSFFFKFVIFLRDGHYDCSLRAQRGTPRHCWQYFHSMTRGRHCMSLKWYKWSFTKQLRWLELSWNVPALLCMFMFTARVLKRAAACIQLLSLFAEQLNGVFTRAVFCLYSAFRQLQLYRHLLKVGSLSTIALTVGSIYMRLMESESECVSTEFKWVYAFVWN